MAEKEEKSTSTTKPNFFDFIKSWGSLIIAIAVVIGQYYVNNYRLESLEKKVDRIEEKVDNQPDIQLLMTQLNEIKKSDDQLEEKIKDTNERINEIYRILISSNK